MPVLSVPAVADIVAGAFGAFTSAAIASIGVTDCSAENEEVNLIYASKYAGIANYWKNRQGMIDALTAHETVELKRKVEVKFEKIKLTDKITNQK